MRPFFQTMKRFKLSKRIIMIENPFMDKADRKWIEGLISRPKDQFNKIGK